MLRRIAKILTLVACICGPALTHADDPAFAQRLASVRTLVESSSAAQRVATSGNVQALASRDLARTHLEEAAKAHSAGETTRAEDLLRRASTAMIKAAQIANGTTEANHVAYSETAITGIEESTRSLAGAARRVAAELGRKAEAEKALASADTLLAESGRRRAAGDLAGARAHATRAYLTVKILLTEMRQGARLVRSLKFANVEEEYVYELDRYDAHRMILQMVQSERSLDASSQAAIATAMRQAEEGRAQAAAAAQRRDHKTAIALLDGATRAVITAIRRAGLYVPG